MTGPAPQAQAKMKPLASPEELYSGDKIYMIRGKVNLDIGTQVIHILSRVQILTAPLEYLQETPAKISAAN